MNSARSACANAATVFRACHLQLFAQHPQQWCRRIDVDVFALAVHAELVSRHRRFSIWIPGTAFPLKPIAELRRRTASVSLVVATASFRLVVLPGSTPREQVLLLRGASTIRVRPTRDSSRGRQQPGTLPHSTESCHSHLASALTAERDANCDRLAHRWHPSFSPDGRSRNSIQPRLCHPDLVPRSQNAGDDRPLAAGSSSRCDS